MKTIVKSCICLLAWICVSVSAQADMISKTYVYDQKSGTFTIAIMGTVAPSEPYSIGLDMKYQATNAFFRSLNFNVSEASSISGSNVNGEGEVHASATNVKSEGGDLVAKLIFGVEGLGTFKGEITSLRINGVEYGPLALPLNNLGTTDAVAPANQGFVTPLSMPPVQVIAIGRNHAVQVFWSHPDDAVLYYQVIAHKSVNNTMTPAASGRSCVAKKGQNYCTIRGLKNGDPVVVVATAIYANGSVEASDSSNIAVPQRLQRSHGVINSSLN